MNYEDEAVEGEEVVRGFMATAGRVRAAVAEVPLETMVATTPHAQANEATLPYERKLIVSRFQEPVAIAEISAVLELPLRSVQVLVSEMVAAGELRQHDTVGTADTTLLQRIRVAVAAL